MPINIKHYRKRLELSQTSFANRLGINQSTVSRYENNVCRLPFEAAVKLKELLSEKLDIDIPIESLMEKK